MATATKKADTAKTNNKSNNKKTPKKKAEGARASTAKTVEKKPMTVGDGLLDEVAGSSRRRTSPSSAARFTGGIAPSIAFSSAGVRLASLAVPQTPRVKR